MKIISDETFSFLVNSYKQCVKEFFDDPDEQFTGWSHKTFLRWYNDMCRLGDECGVKFWTYAYEVATPYEINRVRLMLKAAGDPTHKKFVQAQAN